MSASRTNGNASLAPFSLAEVSLTAGRRLHTAAVVNARYLLSLPVDSLLYNFRTYAQLDTKGAKPLGGWETPTGGDRGHFSGHALSALSKASVSLQRTDPDIAASCLANVTYYVSGLAECQTAIGNTMRKLSANDDDAPPFGYLNAQSPADFDRLETLQQCSVPYYIIHKIMAGLFDAYVFAGSQLALQVVSAMCDYFAWRFSRLSQWTIDQMINTRRYEGQAPAFFMEHGGMLDVLVNVSSVTQKPSHLALVNHFDRRWFRDMLASNNDQLGRNGEHSNTELPVVVGLANLATTLTPPQSTVYSTAVLNFLGWMQSGHEFSTGGVSGKSAYPAPLDYNSELFNSAGLLDRQINGTPGHAGQSSGESCCAHNLQKSSIYAVQWTHSARWADEYEKRLINCVIAQQHPSSGQFLYNLNLKQGASKEFGTPWDSFWCCYGTGVEAFAGLGYGLAYHDDEHSIWLVSYVASTVTWAAQGLTSLVIDSAYPYTGATKMTFTLAQPTQLTINLRIPGWATGGTVALLLNGQPESGVTLTPGTFVAIDRQWSSGDVLELDLPFSLSAEPIPDRCEYVGIKYGPHVLVACGPIGASFVGTTQQLLAALTPAANPCTFTAELQCPLGPKTVTFKPIADVVDESYNGYTLVTQPPTVHVVDSVAIADASSEQAHQFTSLNSGTGTYGGLAWRDAENNGFISYTLAVNGTQQNYLRCLYLGDDVGAPDGSSWRLFDIQVKQPDNSWLTLFTQSLDAEAPGQWYKVNYPLPTALTTNVDSLVFRFQAKGLNGAPGSAGGVFDAIQSYIQTDAGEAVAKSDLKSAEGENGDDEAWELVEA